MRHRSAPPRRRASTESGAQALIARYFDQLDVFADGGDLIVSMAISGERVAELIATATLVAGAQ